MSVALCAAFVVATAAQLVSAQRHSDTRNAEFRECFRWNSTTNSFAGGSNWFDSDACNTWFNHALGWEPFFAFALFFAFLLFPVIFFCARYCCRCCGGPEPSYGCCFPENPRSVDSPPFPGYSNSTIVIVKTFFAFVFTGTTVFTIFLLQHNAKLHTDILGATESVARGLDDVKAKVTTAVPASLALSDSALQIASPDLARDIGRMAITFVHDAKPRVDKVLDEINWRESRFWLGRYSTTIAIPATGLAILVVGLFCAVFNVRQLVGVLLIATCIHTATLWLVTVPHRVLAETAEFACDNYEASVAPIVLGAARRYGACASDETITRLHEMNEKVRTYTSQGNNQLCLDFETLCRDAEICPSTFCENSKRKIPVSPKAPVSGLLQLLTHVIRTAVKYADERPIQKQAVKVAAERLKAFGDTTIPQIKLLSSFATCDDVRNRLDGAVHGNVCDRAAAYRARSVSTGLLFLAVLGFHAVLAFVAGMKRFVPMKSYDALPTTGGGDGFERTSPVEGGLVYNAYDERMPTPGVVVGDLDGAVLNAKEKDVAYVPTSEGPSAARTYGATDVARNTYHM